MTMQVLFNGQVIVRPGAYSAIDASQFQSVPLSGLGVVGLVGEADQGQPSVPLSFMTAQQVKQTYVSGDLVEAAQMVANPGNDPRIPSGAQAIVCYKVNASTQSSFTSAPFLFTSLQWGALQNNITTQVSVSGSGFVVTNTNLNQFNNLIQEVSPVLGATGKFTIVYAGAGSAATITITATTLTTTVTGAAGDDLNLNFSDYPTLAQLLQAIAATGKYTVVSLVTNTNSFASNQLDALTAATIFSTPATIYAKNADIANWINTSSQILSVALTLGQPAISVAIPQSQLTGGTRGVSNNTAWSNAFTALQNIRINQCVPLCSADAASAQGTFTFASVAAAAVAYATQASSTAGQNEVQVWIGAHETLTTLITTANTQNTQHLCFFGQQSQYAASSNSGTYINGVLTPYTAGQIFFFPEWSTACLAAGMRAGAPLGEPLTWKFANTSGVKEDASWSDQNTPNVAQLTLNGVTVLCTVPGSGFRFDKVITTFTKLNNDAYTEETIVQEWKLISYNLRQALQNAFVGRGGTLARVGQVPSVVGDVMQPLKDLGVITDSFVNGQRINAWRNVIYNLNGDTLTVTVTVTPTPGINYVLTTIVLVPAQITGLAA